jgi:hypothetical protein
VEREFPSGDRLSSQTRAVAKLLILKRRVSCKYQQVGRRRYSRGRFVETWAGSCQGGKRNQFQIMFFELPCV